MENEKPLVMSGFIGVVGATRLERATAWSQTRNATNCATPRCFLKATAKVMLFFNNAKEKGCFLYY